MTFIDYLICSCYSRIIYLFILDFKLCFFGLLAIHGRHEHVFYLLFSYSNLWSSFLVLLTTFTPFLKACWRQAALTSSASISSLLLYTLAGSLFLSAFIPVGGDTWFLSESISYSSRSSSRKSSSMSPLLSWRTLGDINFGGSIISCKLSLSYKFLVRFVLLSICSTWFYYTILVQFCMKFCSFCYLF